MSRFPLTGRLRTSETFVATTEWMTVVTVLVAAAAAVLLGL